MHITRQLYGKGAWEHVQYQDGQDRADGWNQHYVPTDGR